MREVQECRRRVREGMLLRVHLELPRYTLVVPVRDLPLACCRSGDLMLLVLVVLVQYRLDNNHCWYMLHDLALQS